MCSGEWIPVWGVGENVGERCDCGEGVGGGKGEMGGKGVHYGSGNGENGNEEGV